MYSKHRSILVLSGPSAGDSGNRSGGLRWIRHSEQDNINAKESGIAQDIR